MGKQFFYTYIKPIGLALKLRLYMQFGNGPRYDILLSNIFLMTVLVIKTLDRRFK